MKTFLIHPSDLQQRRTRCRADVDRLLKLPRQTVVACNVCASPRHVILNSHDRYGLPFRNALCLDCGLFYLVDRFTPEAYSEFYFSGAYRSVSSNFNGVSHSIDQVQANQSAYAKNLARMLAGIAPHRRDGRLLDVGGSAGIVAKEIVSAFGMQGTVLDPANDEVAAARAAGLEAIVGSIEDWQTPHKFDLILLCRSVEHLFDLRLALTRIRALLTPDGLFYCDIADFMEMCRMMGSPEAFTKADHCYWLTQSTAMRIFSQVGFELISMNIVAGNGEVGFLLRACEPKPESVAAATETPLAQVEEIQALVRDWRAFGNTSLGRIDWLRRKVYTARGKVLRALRGNRGAAKQTSSQQKSVPASNGIATDAVKSSS
jgi:SAM-dependent methyltransferase